MTNGGVSVMITFPVARPVVQVAAVGGSHVKHRFGKCTKLPRMSKVEEDFFPVDSQVDTVKFSLLEVVW